MKCDACNVEMTEKGTLDSGNAQYKLFRCSSCATERQVCTGVNNNL